MPKTMHRYADGPDITPFLRGGFGRSRGEAIAPGDEWHGRYFVLLSMFQRFRRREHQLFAGDQVMAMVCAEIWLFNIGRFAERCGTQGLSQRLRASDRESALPKCNAYSIAQALELSPETVRRKIAKLKLRGWLERSAGGELHVTRAWEEQALETVVCDNLDDFGAAARFLANPG